MYTSFMNNQVPALWTRVSFASLKSLSSWNKDLLFRCDTPFNSFTRLLPSSPRVIGLQYRNRHHERAETVEKPGYDILHGTEE